MDDPWAQWGRGGRGVCSHGASSPIAINCRIATVQATLLFRQETILQDTWLPVFLCVVQQWALTSQLRELTLNVRLHKRPLSMRHRHSFAQMPQNK